MMKKSQKAISSNSATSGEAPEWFERNIAEFKEEMLVFLVIYFDD